MNDRPQQPTTEELEALLNAADGGPAITIGPDGAVLGAKIPWPDPTPEMLNDPKFNAIWNVIKSWDVHVPGAYAGYCVSTGNHARAILDALNLLD